MSSPPHSSPNPLGDAAATEDQVGLATAAIVSGFGLATALLSAVTTVTVRLALASGISTPEALSPDAAQVNTMIYGIMVTLVGTGLLAWWLMIPIRSTYRRFGLTMVSVLGGFVLGAVLTALVREMAGIDTLPALGALGLVGAFAAGRRARRLGANPPSSA